MTRILPCLVLAGVLGVSACGSSSPAASPGAPSGTLVVVIHQGPERVPFEPKVRRIQLANQQLSNILGHSIQIELDGSLLPQTHAGAEDVIARLVEDLARDLDALGKEDRKALAFAGTHFERLVVRYAPSESAAREERWKRRSAAKLDVASKTIDVVRAEARPLALDRGEVSAVLYRAFAAGNEHRYARVLPDALPPAEQRSWFEYHAHGGGAAEKSDSYEMVGPVRALRVRGMIMLDTRLKADPSDAALARDVRAWLLDAMSSFASAYHHQTAEVESAPASSPYRQAESAYVGWLQSTLPTMTLDERAKVTANLWVLDMRKHEAERDRHAPYAFPGLDRMGIALDAVDRWIAAGHPPKPGSPEVHPYFDSTVCPAVARSESGRIHFSHAGRCRGELYRWALSTPDREDALVKAALARGDVQLATAIFYNAHAILREEPDYLRFLRRFEAAPALWRVGADVHRAVGYRPSTALLEESRRLWRESPAARGHALFWFARHAGGSYHPDKDWPDMLQSVPADDAAFGAFLELGWEAFEQLPAVWPGLAKSPGRMRLVTTTAKRLLEVNVDVQPGGSGVAGTLASVARLLCEERSMGELAELRAFAESELPSRPGAGLSDVVSESDPTRCAAKPRAAPPKRRKPGGS